jgi:hypothetical protein
MNTHKSFQTILAIVAGLAFSYIFYYGDLNIVDMTPYYKMLAVLSAMAVIANIGYYLTSNQGYSALWGVLRVIFAIVITVLTVAGCSVIFGLGSAVFLGASELSLWVGTIMIVLVHVIALDAIAEFYGQGSGIVFEKKAETC